MGAALSSFVFQAPSEATYAHDPNLIWLTTSEQEVIPAFFLDKGAKYTMLFSHGNAEDLGGDGVVKKMREMSSIIDVNVFAYEYTGYGMSTGEASEEALYSDIEAAYKYLNDVIGVPAEQIIIYGWSIGSGPSVHLAAKRCAAGGVGEGCRALVLQSPLASVYRVALPSQVTLPGDMFCNVDKIGEVSCPVFIVHGTRDETIPLWHAQELASCCRKECLFPPLYAEGAGHCDLEKVARREFFDKLLEFLKWLDDEEARGFLGKKDEAAEPNDKRLRAVALDALRSLSACRTDRGGKVPRWEEVSADIKQKSQEQHH